MASAICLYVSAHFPWKTQDEVNISRPWNHCQCFDAGLRFVFVPLWVPCLYLVSSSFGLFDFCWTSWLLLLKLASCLNFGLLFVSRNQGHRAPGHNNIWQNPMFYFWGKRCIYSHQLLSVYLMKYCLRLYLNLISTSVTYLMIFTPKSWQLLGLLLSSESACGDSEKHDTLPTSN